MAALRWLNLYVETLDVLIKNDSIYLYDFGNEYADIRINKKVKYFAIGLKLWNNLANEFSINFNDTKEIFTIWAESNYNMVDVEILCIFGRSEKLLEMPLK